MRLDIRYTTRFEYSGPVRESQNELRACPAEDERQRLLSYRVVTTPPSRVLSFHDYWGTRVDAFGVREPHTSLEIAAEASVETSAARPVAASSPLASLGDPGFRERHLEYLERSPHVDWGEAVAKEARERAAWAGEDVASVVLALHRTVGSSLSYVRGITYVGMAVDDVLACGAGVCQDFTHLVIAMCRSQGIPARYVSGYLFAADRANRGDDEQDVVDVETHAWLEVAIPGVGWWGLDSTNQCEISPRHVKIGHGRDYDDVTPFARSVLGPPRP